MLTISGSDRFLPLNKSVPNSIIISKKKVQSSLYSSSDSSKNIQTGWNVKEFDFGSNPGDWGYISKFKEHFIAVGFSRISFFNGVSLKKIISFNNNKQLSADFNNNYLAYSTHPVWRNYALKQQLFISKIREKNGTLKLIKSHKFNIPFSQSISGIKFISENKILIVSFLEYGIVNIISKPGSDFYIKFRHYPFELYNAQNRLLITETLEDKKILTYSGKGVNILQKLPENKIRLKNLFYFTLDPASKRADEAEIDKLAALNSSSGAFLLKNKLIYYLRSKDSNGYNFLVQNYIHLNNSDSINTKEIKDIKFLSPRELLCLTNNGLILKQEIGNNKHFSNYWKAVKIPPFTNPGFLNIVNADTFVVNEENKLFLIFKGNGNNKVISGSKTNTPVFDIEPLAQTSNFYGVGLGDLENNNKTSIYLVDVYDRNKFFTSIPNYYLNNFPDNKAVERGISGRSSNITPGRNNFNLEIGVAIGDINEDGAEDLILTNLSYSNSLYLNNGKGYFQDVTNEYGFNVNMWRSEGAVLGDVNNDGYLDIFNTSFFKSNKLFINNHGVSLNDETNKYGLHSNGRSISAVFGDVNNDGFLDLYVGNWVKGNKLFINNGHGKFIDRTNQSGVGGGNLKETNSIFFADLNNDGYLDLFVGNRAGGDKLYLNNKDGTFRDVTKECGLDGDYHTYGAVFGDFDNDGWQDIVLACLGGVKYFKNLGIDKSGMIHFKDITNQCIPSKYVSPAYNTGLATADFGNKGFLDLVMNQNGGHTYFFLNNTSLDGTNNFLSVKVEGDESNRDAVGAKLKLFSGDSLIGYREVSGGFGYASSSSKIQHFGLKNLTGPFKLWVNFPATYITKIISVMPNTFITVKEHSGIERKYFLTKKSLLRFFYGNGFILLGIELLLLLLIFSGLISVFAKILKLRKNPSKKIYFNKYIMFFSLVIFYIVKIISVESMSFYFGPVYFIVNSANIFTDEILPLLTSCAFAYTWLLVLKNRETKNLSFYTILDGLLIALKRFEHGEGMLIVLHRLSLLIENLNFHNESESLYEKESLDRINSAFTEYKEAIFPEILRIYTLLNQFDSSKFNKEEKHKYPKYADSILDSGEHILNDCKVLLSATILNEKIKAKEDIIYSIRKLKEELSKLRLNIRLNFSIDISVAISVAIRKFQDQYIDLKINMSQNDEKVNAVISSSDFNELINIIIRNSIDEFNEKNIRSGTINISFTNIDGKVIIKIEDNGNGITDENKEKIFNDGFTTKSKGHGLGLGIVKKCLSKYDGKISIADGKSGGALFIVELKSI